MWSGVHAACCDGMVWANAPRGGQGGCVASVPPQGLMFINGSVRGRAKGAGR